LTLAFNIPHNLLQGKLPIIPCWTTIQNAIYKMEKEMIHQEAGWEMAAGVLIIKFFILRNEFCNELFNFVKHDLIIDS
jgi:hypothetical protein